MSRDWQKDIDMLKEADGWEFKSTFDGEGNITKGTTTIAEHISVSYAGTIFNAFESLKYWLQQYAAEKERADRLHKVIEKAVSQSWGVSMLELLDIKKELTASLYPKEETKPAVLEEEEAK